MSKYHAHNERGLAAWREREIGLGAKLRGILLVSTENLSVQLRVRHPTYVKLGCGLNLRNNRKCLLQQL